MVRQFKKNIQPIPWVDLLVWRISRLKAGGSTQKKNEVHCICRKGHEESFLGFMGSRGNLLIDNSKNNNTATLNTTKSFLIN